MGLLVLVTAACLAEAGWVLARARGTPPAEEMAALLRVTGEVAGLALLVALPAAYAVAGARVLVLGDGALGRLWDRLLFLGQGVPALAVGTAGLAVLVHGLSLGFSVLAGGVTAGILALPRLAREACRAMAAAWGEVGPGVLALGIPPAAAGSLCLRVSRRRWRQAVGRALGTVLADSAALVVTGGVAPGDGSLLGGGATVAVRLWYALQQGDVSAGSPAAFLAGWLLVLAVWLASVEE